MNANEEPTPLALHVAMQLRKFRLAAGMTQAELAARSNVTVETVARLERVVRGKSSANANPSLETLESLATSLGCEISDLLTRKSLPKSDPILAKLRLLRPATRVQALAVIDALIRTDQRQRKAG
jgi:transcriptional regulator with XRE-family HTH domain